MTSLPQPRTGLYSKQIADEVIVYDGKSQEAHCLNKTAGLVFRLCQEAINLNEAVLAVESELSLNPGEGMGVIRKAIAKLSKLKLFVPEQAALWTRRKALSAVGKAAAVVAVSSVVAPRPAQALSCITCNSVPSCAKCGDLCDDGVANCEIITRCTFEYTYDTANDGLGNPCTNEGTGQLGCRFNTFVQNFFNFSCPTARGNIAACYAANPGNELVACGNLYYCCQCVGLPAGILTDQTC